MERRSYAVGRVRIDGVRISDAADEVGRSRQWLHKWLVRFDSEGEAGLVDQSRAPRRRPTAIPQHVVDRILEVRDRLEAHPFANRGAEAIRYELIQAGDPVIPSESTIERVLARAGKTGSRDRQAPSAQTRPLPVVTSPGKWQQIDWVGPRWLAHRVRFSSLHLIDVGGGGAAAAQYPDEKLQHTAGFLTDRAWRSLSVPFHLQTDGAFVAQPPGLEPRPFNTFVRCCLFFGVEVVISPPDELGWQNWVESFNGLWQARTIRRHSYQSPAEVSVDSDRFIDYYQWRKPHPRLQVSTHGTRFPGQLINDLQSQLRFPPSGFSIANYTDRHGRPHIPLARGRLSYLRRVQPGGIIEISRAHYPVPTTTVGLVVCATILTASQRLIVRHAGQIIATHRFPQPEPVTEPYHPTAPRGLFYTINESTIS